MSDSEGLFEFRQINCPVCDSGRSKKVGYRGGEAHHSRQGVKTTIVRCVDCTHQYPNPMPFPTVNLDEIYVDAAEYFVNHDLEEKKRNCLGLIEKFEKRLGRKGDFLDVGCGRGELIWAAKESGWNFQGIDPSKDFVEFGRQYLGVEAQIGTLEEVNFPAESFDAVALGGIIEHLYNPAEILGQVQRLLRPNGWLYFDAPNEDGLYMQIGNAYMRLRGKDWVVVLAPTFSPFHVQGFNPNSIQKLVDGADFVIRDFRIFGEISPQTGNRTFRKVLEYRIGKCLNWVGNLFGKGMYMEVWAQKRDN